MRGLSGIAQELTRKETYTEVNGLRGGMKGTSISEQRTDGETDEGTTRVSIIISNAPRQ